MNGRTRIGMIALVLVSVASCSPQLQGTGDLDGGDAGSVGGSAGRGDGAPGGRTGTGGGGLGTGGLASGGTLGVGGATGIGGGAGRGGASGGGGVSATGGAATTGGASGSGGRGGSGGGTGGAGPGSGGAGPGSGGAGPGGSLGSAGQGSGGVQGGGGSVGAGGNVASPLVFTQIGPTGNSYQDVRCGADACYVTALNGGAKYQFVYRLAHNATSMTNVSTGLMDAEVGGLSISGRDDLWVTQSALGVFKRAANATSFVAVGDPLSTTASSRHSLALGGTGTLYVATFAGIYGLAPNGLTFSPVGTGLTGAADGVAIDGTNLFAVAYSVKNLPGATGTWLETALDAPNAVHDFVFDRAHNLYATTNGFGTAPAGVYRLLADRTTWENITGALPVDAFKERLDASLAFDSANRAFLVVKGGIGKLTPLVYARTPGATDWSLIISSGLPNQVRPCVGLDFDATGRLVVACSTGVYRSTL